MSGLLERIKVELMHLVGMGDRCPWCNEDKR